MSEKLNSFLETVKLLPEKEAKELWLKKAETEPKLISEFVQDYSSKKKDFPYLAEIEKDLVMTSFYQNPGLYSAAVKYKSGFEYTKNFFEPDVLNKISETNNGQVFILNNAVKLEKTTETADLIEKLVKAQPTLFLNSADNIKHSLFEDKDVVTFGNKNLDLTKLKETAISNIKNNFGSLSPSAKAEASGYVIAEANELHDLPDAERFKVIKNYKQADLYDVINLQKDNLYTSSFNYCFTKFMKDNKNLSDYAVNKPEGVELLEAAINFGRADEIIKKLSSDDQKKLIDKSFENITNHARYPAITMEVLKNAKDEKVKEYFEEKIGKAYDKGTERERNAFSLIASVYQSNNPDRHVDFYDKFSEADKEKFALKKYDKVKFDDLTDEVTNQTGKTIKVNNQIHKFYNDEDGKAYYRQFTESLNGKGWTIVKNDNEKGFVHYSKTNGSVQINMIICKPEAEGNSLRQAVNYVKEDLHQNVHMVTHRGHSFNTSRTVDEIPKETKIAILGSCNGAISSNNALSRTDDMQPPISTKNTGVGAINTRITNYLNDQILHGKDINWKELRGSLNKMGDNRTQDYVLPNEDNLFIMTQKYYKLVPTEMEISMNFSKMKNLDLASIDMSSVKQAKENPVNITLPGSKNNSIFLG